VKRFTSRFRGKPLSRRDVKGVHGYQVVAPELAGSLDKMQNSLPSGSARVIQPLPSGRRWSASCEAPSARIRPVSCSRVRAVLHRLAIRDGNEKQQLAPVSRHDEAFLVPGLVRIIRVLGEVQYLRPEDRLCVSIPGVDRRVRYTASHDGSLSSRCGTVKRFTLRQARARP
jgi:hypothetical protein